MGLYQKSILFQETPPSLRATSFFPCLRGSTPKGGWGGRTEDELVIYPEYREYFSSPSVYRGSTPKGGGSSFFHFQFSILNFQLL